MSESRIAYFSMEIALHPATPTYSGGLGMLTADMIRAAADRELPMVAVTLLHRKGYFYQTLDGSGWQTEDSVEWIVEDFLEELPHRAAVTLVGVRAFDPFPYGLLTMIVSLEAISLSTVVLISQDRLSGEIERRADLDLHIGLLSEHGVADRA